MYFAKSTKNIAKIDKLLRVFIIFPHEYNLIKAFLKSMIIEYF